MIELTHDDHRRIAEAMGPAWNGVFIAQDINRVYIAGVLSGIERAASLFEDGSHEGAVSAAAIRELSR